MDLKLSISFGQGHPPLAGPRNFVHTEALVSEDGAGCALNQCIIIYVALDRLISFNRSILCLNYMMIYFSIL